MADETSLSCLSLTSCCAARFLTGRGPVPVRGPGVGDPYPRRPIQPQVACCIPSLQRLLAERDSLREANEELRCAQMQPRGLTQAGELEAHPRAWEMAGLEPYLAWCAVRAGRKGSVPGLV